MDRVVIISIAIAAAVAFGYFVVMRIFFKESKELDKKIDYSKMKESKDED